MRLRPEAIIYNQELLREAGIIRTAGNQTRISGIVSEAGKAEIKPIMNHYKETLLTTTSQLLWVQMVQKDQEESINALADFLDSTLYMEITMPLRQTEIQQGITFLLSGMRC